MNLLLVTVAFLSIGQAGQGGHVELSASASELTQNNRAEAEGPSAGSVDASAERRICRRQAVSGSHRYQRVCLTAEQWRQQED